MANIRVKDLPNTDTLVDGDELIVDSSSAGTRRVSYAEVKSEIAADYVAAPSTYKVATLAADNKLDPSQIPDTISGGYNFVGVANNVGDLTSTTQGDFYVIQTAFGAYSVGDRAVYDGSAYVRVTDGTVLIAEGGTGAITAADARTNLSVNSIDEDAEAIGTKLLGPSVYFDGSNDVVTVADATSMFHFNDGTDDLPFTVEGFIKLNDATSSPIVGKYGTSNATREWLFSTTGSDKLEFTVQDTGARYETIQTDATLTAYEGKWVHVAASFAGAGPNSTNSFLNASQGMTIYINGSAVATSENSSGSAYLGMLTDTGQALWVGKQSSTFFDGSIRNLRIHNRELTASEVAELAKGNELGFADEWGDHTTGVYTGDSSTFASSLGNWTEEGVTSITVAQAGGEMVITNTAASTGTRGARNLIDDIQPNQRYRLKFKVRTSSGTGQQIQLRFFTSAVDLVDINLLQGGGSAGSIGSSIFYIFTPTGSDVWHELEFVMSYSAADNLFIGLNSTGAGEVYNFDDITLVPIGTLADFRSERFDSSTGKWYDLSDNAFVGTNSGATLVGREVPVYTTGSWTPTITFGGGSTGVTYTEQEGFYVRIGNLVRFMGSIRLSSKGTDTGALKIAGLPFTGKNTSTSNDGVILATAANFTGLTSTVTARVDNNDTTITVLQWAATGTTGVTDAECTNTTVIGVSGTYQIQ